MSACPDSQRLTEAQILESKHTFLPDCPACAEFKAAQTNQETDELVDALMKEWDSMITIVGNRLVEKVREVSHKRLAKFKKESKR